MNPVKGDYVKITFRTGSSVEGFVLSWSDKKVVLSSSEKMIKPFMIIHNVEQDVYLTKISDPPKESNPISSSLPKRVNKQNSFMEEKYLSKINKEENNNYGIPVSALRKSKQHTSKKDSSED